MSEYEIGKAIQLIEIRLARIEELMQELFKDEGKDGKPTGTDGKPIPRTAI